MSVHTFPAFSKAVPVSGSAPAHPVLKQFHLRSKIPDAGEVPVQSQFSEAVLRKIPLAFFQNTLLPVHIPHTFLLSFPTAVSHHFQSSKSSKVLKAAAGFSFWDPDFQKDSEKSSGFLFDKACRQPEKGSAVPFLCK